MVSKIQWCGFRYSIKDNMWEIIQASSEKHQGPSARYGHSLVTYDVGEYINLLISFFYSICLSYCFRKRFVRKGVLKAVLI